MDGINPYNPAQGNGAPPANANGDGFGTPVSGGMPFPGNNGSGRSRAACSPLSSRTRIRTPSVTVQAFAAVMV
ncbi:LOW QUALITY PROTEIN: mRNA binding post-transcriptional regulator [Colletotrichum tofieldiae]|nr:LOW QUALITY PROTEIN: mRNA binding post-transcriptional regulator [Colletotrichum tofieldiae]